MKLLQARTVFSWMSPGFFLDFKLTMWFWLINFFKFIFLSFYLLRASMIWIIGEYAERIDNADELLESFLDSFQDENTQVQLQLLTAIVKLFLKRPTDTQELVQQVTVFPQLIFLRQGMHF